MKKLILPFLLLLMTVILSGCHLFNRQSYKDVNYEDLTVVYNQSYYDLLPSSLYQQAVVDKYEDINIMELVTDVINGEYEEHIPKLPMIDVNTPEEMIPSNLTHLTFEQLQQSVNTIGPTEIVYVNIAAVQYMLQIIEEMNSQFEEYGMIEFDNTEIVIPEIEFTGIDDPLNTGETITFNDVKAKYTKEGKVSNILMSTVNDYEYQDSMGIFSGEIGLFLDVKISMSNDNDITLEINFYLTCDLSLEGSVTDSEKNDTGEMNYEIGYSVKAIDNKQVIVNSNVFSSIKIDLVNNHLGGIEIPDIDESIYHQSSFVLTKQKDGIDVCYHIISNLFDTLTVKYYLTADESGSILYMDGSASDEDFYGENIPAQRVISVFIYDENHQLLFIGGDVSLNLPLYDEFDQYLGTKPYDYVGFIWNLNDLSGWTKIALTNSMYPKTYELYQDDTIILDAESQQGTYEEDKLIEMKEILASRISVDDYDYDIGGYLHMIDDSTMGIELPEGLTSTKYDFVNDVFLNMSDYIDSREINLNDDLYEVPELDKQIFD